MKNTADACVDAGINVATVDSGWATWACYQSHCGAIGDAGGVGTLPACAADCTCNTAFANALRCVLEDGALPSCFTPAVTSGDGGLQWYMQCFMANMGVCGSAPPGDAGITPNDSGDAGG